jgi:hypothetical protein
VVPADPGGHIQHRLLIITRIEVGSLQEACAGGALCQEPGPLAWVLPHHPVEEMGSAIESVGPGMALDLLETCDREPRPPGVLEVDLGGGDAVGPQGHDTLKIHPGPGFGSGPRHSSMDSKRSAGLQNNMGGSEDALTGLRSGALRCPPLRRCGSRRGIGPNGPRAQPVALRRSVGDFGAKRPTDRPG